MFRSWLFYLQLLQFARGPEGLTLHGGDLDVVLAISGLYFFTESSPVEGCQFWVLEVVSSTLTSPTVTVAQLVRALACGANG